MSSTAQRSSGCPSAFELEAFFAGEPGPLGTHVTGCPMCTAYVATLSEGRDAFNRARPAEMFLKQVERKAATTPAGWRPSSSWRWAVAGLALLLAVVAGALNVLLPTHDNGVTLKGSAFRVLVKRGDAGPAAVLPDAHLSEGDALRFSYEATEDGQLAVLDLDGTERVTAFYPAQGEHSAPVRAGADPLLPGSTVLDAAPGPEWLVAVFSKTPFELAPLAEQLRGQSRRASLDLRCDGCRIQTLRVQKAAR